MNTVRHETHPQTEATLKSLFLNLYKTSTKKFIFRCVSERNISHTARLETYEFWGNVLTEY